MNMKHGLFGRASALALCACSLSALGMTESIPEFGSSLYATIADKPTTTMPLTMSVWFKGTSIANFQTIFGACGRNSNGGPLTIYCRRGAGKALGAYGRINNTKSGDVQSAAMAEMVDSNWHLATATLADGKYTLYLDGVEVKNLDKGAEAVPASGYETLTLGRDPAVENYRFGGSLTDASLWTRALSADEVKALYDNKLRLSGKETGLWGYWPLNDATDGTFADKTGNNHNGTYQGTATLAEAETPFTAAGTPVIVSYTADGVKVIDDQVVIPNTKIFTVPEVNPVKVGARFTGWSKDGGTTIVTAEETAVGTYSASVSWIAQFEADARPTYDLPTVAETAIYTGVVQKPEIAESEGYTVVWTGDWTHVGEHTVTLTLTDPEGSTWNDGSTEPKTYTCTITQAPNAWTVEPTIASQWEIGTTPDLSRGTPAFGEVVMTPADLAALPTGAAKVTFTVAGTDDYTALEKAVAVFVVPKGLKPTGDPDTVATTYTWAGEESGYWYNPGSWTSSAEPCFGFPANGVATALFKDATATVEGNTLAYDLAKLQISSSAVTLKGGSYAPTSVALDGTAPTLVLTDGAELAPATRQALQLTSQQNVTLAVTNATLKTGISIRNGATGFTATLHNATFDGAFELANSGATTADSDQSVIFSGADSKLAFGDGTSFNNQGLAVCFETGVNAAFSAREVKVGKNSSLTFAGENEISATGYIYANGDNATITFGPGAQMTSGNGLNDFGLYRNASGLTNARTIIDNATVTAGNQVYMPHPNKANLAGCGVTFKGDHPRVSVGNTDVYIGKATPAEGEVLPSWRYELPATPYEVAPLVITAAAAKVRFVSNTPIELDLTAVMTKGRYPLMTFAADPGVEVEQLTAAMSAFTVRATGAKRDAKARVTLGYDAETKTIYADVAKAPGMTLLVR